MKREETDNTGRVGIHAVGLAIEKTLSWIFREYPMSDHGIDAHIEIVDQRRDATGRLIALQIKSGTSYFKEKVQDGYVFRGDTNHLNYWMRHSLPVIVVLHNPTLELSYWQVVHQQTIERTEKGWKMTIPTSQTLDASAREKLSSIADIPDEQRRLASLALAKPWMELLKAGTPLFLKAEEWINKSSGRGSLTLFTPDDEGQEKTIEDWPFVMFPGQQYAELLPVLFPWADLSVDEDIYDEYDEQAYDEECGIWDSEDGRYIMYTDDYSDWQRGMASIRPYTVASGEVALFQLQLTLNEIGSAYLSLEKYLGEGIVSLPPAGRAGQGYNLGLKSLIRKYGLDSESKE
jgi:hypothetical protein